MDQEEISKWRKIRWGTTIVFLLFFTAMAFLPFIVEISETAFLIGYILAFVLSFIPFMWILNRPYSKSKDRTFSDSKKKTVSQIKGKIKEPEKKVFIGHVDVWFLLIIIIPTALFTIIPMMLTYEIVMISISMGTLVFFGLIIGLFYRLKIEADLEHVHFHWGPIGKTIRTDEIRSIEAITVHALKDYMGWGIRSGTDGSLGYISQSKTGIRIETNSDKVYVISCNEAQELADLIKWAIQEK